VLAKVFVFIKKVLAFVIAWVYIDNNSKITKAIKERSE